MICTCKGTGKKSFTWDDTNILKKQTHFLSGNDCNIEGLKLLLKKINVWYKRPYSLSFLVFKNLSVPFQKEIGLAAVASISVMSI